MNFLLLTLFILVGTGITNIVVNSTVLEKLREFLIASSAKLNKTAGSIMESLLSCMMCSGFWIGLILSVFFPIQIIMAAVIISLTSHFYGTVIGTLSDISDVSESLIVEHVEEEE